MKNNLKSRQKNVLLGDEVCINAKEKKENSDFCFDRGKKKTTHELSEGNLHVHPNCVVMKLLKPVMLNA